MWSMNFRRSWSSAVQYIVCFKWMQDRLWDASITDKVVPLAVNPENEGAKCTLKCKTLGGIHIMQVSHSTAATHIYALALCIYCAWAYECLAAPSRPSPVSRLFHAGCTSS